MIFRLLSAYYFSFYTKGWSVYVPQLARYMMIIKDAVGLTQGKCLKISAFNLQEAKAIGPNNQRSKQLRLWEPQKKKKEDLNASFSTFNEILGHRDPVHPKPRWVHCTLLTANEQ